jgi:hypothetical protein
MTHHFCDKSIAAIDTIEQLLGIFKQFVSTHNTGLTDNQICRFCNKLIV